MQGRPQTDLRPRKPRALLGTDRPYDGGATLSVGSYDPELVSMLLVGSQPVDLGSRLHEPARSRLVAVEEHILLSEEELGAVCEPAPKSLASTIRS